MAAHSVLPLVRRSGPIMNRMLGAGLPLGPNRLLTVRGRTSGQPRTTPVALVESNGLRWIVGTYGDVHWTKNLRAAGEAELQAGDAVEHVRARELGTDEAAAWFRDTLGPYLRRQSLAWRLLGKVLLRTAAPEILTDPTAAARSRPVFELTRQTP